MKLGDIPVTYWLLGALLAVFIMQIIGWATGEPFTESLMLKPASIVQGQELWGLFTNMFLHAPGVLHIAFNSLALFTFGIALERIIGGKNLLMLFLVAGLFASLFYVITSVFLLNSTTPALGASGAIFGVIGAMIVMRPHTKVFMMFVPVPMDLWIAGLFFVAIIVFWFGIGGGTGIAENAHLGGLIVGMLFGYYFKNKERSDPDFTWKAVYKPVIAKDPYDWIDEYR